MVKLRVVWYWKRYFLPKALGDMLDAKVDYVFGFFVGSETFLFNE